MTLDGLEFTVGRWQSFETIARKATVEALFGKDQVINASTIALKLEGADTVFAVTFDQVNSVIRRLVEKVASSTEAKVAEDIEAEAIDPIGSWGAEP